jgi:hypothetical protein
LEETLNGVDYKRWKVQLYSERELKGGCDELKLLMERLKLFGEIIVEIFLYLRFALPFWVFIIIDDGKYVNSFINLEIL